MACNPVDNHALFWRVKGTTDRLLAHVKIFGALFLLIGFFVEWRKVKPTL
jgi:hypothetical protein